MPVIMFFWRVSRKKLIFIQLAVFHFFETSKLSQVSKLRNMNEKKFVDHDTSVEDFVESLENNTKEKTKWDVKLLETFLRNEKNNEREVQNIEPAELNKHLADLIRSVRRKDEEDYQPSSLISVCV